jgi:hypothetical protein
MWKPISKEELSKHIELLEFIFNEEQKCFWDFIKIEPEKWAEDTMGAEGGGFWVVAIMGRNALYYNDVEDGYNFSTYTRYGILDEYQCGQSELHEVIGSIYESLKEGKFNK